AIVVAGQRFGDMAVFRYTTGGTLDMSFDTDGVVTRNVSGTDVAYGVVVQSNGRIVVGGNSQDGSSNSRLALMRLMPDGAIDMNFGTNGVATTAGATGLERVRDVALAADSHILAA